MYLKGSNWLYRIKLVHRMGLCRYIYTAPRRHLRQETNLPSLNVSLATSPTRPVFYSEYQCNHRLHVRDGHLISRKMFHFIPLSNGPPPRQQIGLYRHHPPNQQQSRLCHRLSLLLADLKELALARNLRWVSHNHKYRRRVLDA
jgi:hypothetical protein